MLLEWKFLGDAVSRQNLLSNVSLVMLSKQNLLSTFPAILSRQNLISNAVSHNAVSHNAVPRNAVSRNAVSRYAVYYSKSKLRKLSTKYSQA